MNDVQSNERRKERKRNRTRQRISSDFKPPREINSGNIHHTTQQLAKFSDSKSFNKCIIKKNLFIYHLMLKIIYVFFMHVHWNKYRERLICGKGEGVISY